MSLASFSFRLLSLAFILTEFASRSLARPANTVPNTVPGALTEVVNGVPASPGEFPYAGYLTIRTGCLENSGADICGSSLIAPRVLVTAAHCMHICDSNLPSDALPGEGLNSYNENVTYGAVSITLNQLNISLPPQNGSESYETSKISVHPKYVFDQISGYPIQYDLALLFLNESSSIQPVQFADGRGLYALGQPLQVAGWGYTSPDYFSVSSILMTATVPYVPLANCEKVYNYTMWPGFMCAGANPANFADTCAGDSGGPLVLNGTQNASSHRLVGSTSYGYSCADLHPGVYTNLLLEKEWIDEEMILRNGGGGVAPPLQCSPHVGQQFRSRHYIAVLSRIATAGQCCNACKVNYASNCTAWTWNAHKRRCFLMANVDRRVLLPGWTSGNVTGSIPQAQTAVCEMENYIQYSTPSRTRLTLRGLHHRFAGSVASNWSTPEGCCAACMNATDCTHMTFSKSRQTCTLYSGPTSTSGWGRRAWQYDFVSALVIRK